MPYQYVREPLTAEEADRLANACDTPTEKLVVWTLLDTGLRVGELCDLTSKSVLSQQRQLRFKGKGGPYGKKTKIRVVPMSSRVALQKGISLPTVQMILGHERLATTAIYLNFTDVPIQDEFERKW